MDAGDLLTAENLLLIAEDEDVDMNDREGAYCLFIGLKAGPSSQERWKDAYVRDEVGLPDDMMVDREWIQQQRKEVHENGAKDDAAERESATWDASDRKGTSEDHGCIAAPPSGHEIQQEEPSFGDGERAEETEGDPFAMRETTVVIVDEGEEPDFDDDPFADEDTSFYDHENAPYARKA